MIFISPFTPLFFDSYKDYGIKSRYVQVFSSNDVISIQVIASGLHEVPTIMLHDEMAGNDIMLVWNVWSINSDTTLYFYNLKNLDEGFYRIVIGDKESDIFNVTDDVNVLSLTTLIKYTMKDNLNRQDVYWNVNDSQVYFCFRAPGGFKDKNWAFVVDNEQYTSANGEIVDLYSNDMINKTFTLGNASGCPIYYGALLNRILCCSYVYFDGVRYSRVDNNVPEKVVIQEGIDSFVFNVLLRESSMIDVSEPALEMRTVDSDIFRILDFNGETKNLVI